MCYKGNIMNNIKKGFTLIELLVVIAIIALLLSIMMPALGKVKEKAKAVVCASNQHQVGLSMATYAAMNSDAIIPPVTWSNWNAQSGFYTWGGRLFHELRFIKSSNYLFCPTTKMPDGMTRDWEVSNNKADPYVSIEEWSPRHTFGLRAKQFNSWGSKEVIKLSHIKQPSRYYLVTDTSHPTFFTTRTQFKKAQFYLFDSYHVFFYGSFKRCEYSYGRRFCCPAKRG